MDYGTWEKLVSVCIKSDGTQDFIVKIRKKLYQHAERQLLEILGT